MPDRSPVRLYLRGRIWWTWCYDANGRRIPQSTKCTSKRAAETVARRLEEQAVGAAEAAPQEACTVAEALGRLAASNTGWSEGTERSHQSRAKTINYYLGDLDLTLLDKSRLAGYVDKRRDDGASDHGIYKELNLLSQAVKGQGREWPKDFAHAARYVPRERWLTHKEARLLLGRWDDWHRDWLEGALYTGARYGEVNEADWRDIDWKVGALHIRGGKTPGSDRHIPLPPHLLAKLRRRKEASGSIWGKWWKAERDLKAACKAIGLDDVTPNDLRRTTCTWMAIEGVDPYLIARWLGNSIQMVMRVYAKVNPAALRPAARALPDLKAQKAPKRDRSRFVAGSSRGGLAQLENLQVPPSAAERARRESNPRPLASEANGFRSARKPRCSRVVAVRRAVRA